MAIGIKKMTVLGIAAAAAAGLGIAAATTTSTGSDASVAHLNEAQRADLVMVKWYADWCPSCQKLAPTWDAAKGAMSTDGVLFVKLDKTNDAKTKQAEYMTAQLDLAPMWDRYGNKTGVITMHDAKTGDMIEQFGVGTSVSDIRQAIADAR